MSGLDTMLIRLKYNGGKRQIDRMNEDKLRSLKKALLYSYQSATAILEDGREFRCLINPDKIKNEYDNKYISIPFKDICLNAEEIEDTISSNKIQEIGLKEGDIFTWKENGTDWLVYLRRLEETAYFRAEIRRCKYSVLINNKEYKCYASRASLNEIDWLNKNNNNWNELDYTLEMYITKDENTENFFHRFSIIKLNNKNWEVQSVDDISSNGILIIYLKEWYQNTIQEEKEKEDLKNKEEDITPESSYIKGPKEVNPYDNAILYSIVNAENGSWEIDNRSKAEIIEQNSESVKIKIISGRSGNFNLKYIRSNEDDILVNIKIKSL